MTRAPKQVAVDTRLGAGEFVPPLWQGFLNYTRQKGGIIRRRLIDKKTIDATIYVALEVLHKSSAH